MTYGELRDWVTLSDDVDDGTPADFVPSRVPASIVEYPPGSFDEQKNTLTIWIQFHPQVTTHTKVGWYDFRRSVDRLVNVKGFRDVRQNGVIWLEMLCEEVRTP